MVDLLDICRHSSDVMGSKGSIPSVHKKSIQIVPVKKVVVPLLSIMAFRVSLQIEGEGLTIQSAGQIVQVLHTLIV